MAKTSGEDLLKQDFTDEGSASSDTANEAMDAADAGQNAETSDVGKLEAPKTQSISKNNIFLLIGVLVACGIGVAYFWLSDKETVSSEKNPFAEKKPETSRAVTAPVLQGSGGAPGQGAISLEAKQPEKMPEPAPLQPALLSPVSKPAPALPQISAGSQAGSTAGQAQGKYDAKIKSSMMLGGGQSGSKGTGSELPKLDAATANGDFRPKLTVASSTQVAQVGDLSNIITQGKMIDSVLETPINTLYPGPIRALISRDVFSEKGSNILIPRGSRVLGTLKGGYTPGITRVSVNWDRIILPNGYDISIASAPGVNKLGMMGIEGIVNRQFIETIGSAALLSIINISAANVVEKYFDIKPSIVTTSSNDALGPNVRSQTALGPTQQAAQSEVQNLSNITKDWLKQNFLPTPYIVINQGTRLKIFVNQDIRFPKNLNEGVSFSK
jgi:type IV secretion system protein VirB10